MPGYWQSCRIRADTDQGHGQGRLCSLKTYCSLLHMGLSVQGNCQNMTGSRARVPGDWAQIEGREKGMLRIVGVAQGCGWSAEVWVEHRQWRPL